MSEERVSKVEDLENLGVVRRIVETVDIKSDRLDEIYERINELDSKLDRIDSKLNKILTGYTDKSDLKEIHMKIIDLLGSWLTTKNLAKIMNYRHEYISRKVSELKKMGLIEEKRDGKSIQYKRKDGIKEALESEA
ncbi:MAG: hypothetical protein ACLFS3_02050 [Candidatus Aenigmatarchaeota archaeon]